MNKPTVTYKDGNVVMNVAFLTGVKNHPNHLEGHDVSNDPSKVIRTSRVLDFDPETGRIETLNTIYEKEAA